MSDDPGQYNLATIQGGGELGNELSTLLDDPDWQRLWSQYCRLLVAPREVVDKDNITHSELYLNADGSINYGGGGGNPSSIPRLAAFAYVVTKNTAYAQAAISRIRAVIGGTRTADVPNNLNDVTDPNGDTNSASQDSLNIIEVLAMCADQLPTAAPAPAARNGGTARGGGGGRAGAGGGGRGAGAPPAGSGN
jgi:hypothetical protein